MTDLVASPFHHRAFTHFWFARVATTMAYQMLAVAVGWQIYALTSSALDLGLIGLVQFLPSLVLVLVSGHVADRYDRRAVVGTSQTMQAIAVMVLAVFSFHEAVTELLIFALVALIGSARAFEAPTLQALLPGLVPPRRAAARGRRVGVGESDRRHHWPGRGWSALRARPDRGVRDERVAVCAG